ncbi:hypothetical protein RE6C_05828 [Rhodopirellula europaea 6C]|uniref:Uncharacterized protein n=1 Tax=Rhodopirellula europaea 6C TaxID=1263867 RepID=M2A3B1_9BACT|nr:hypothetical protein RE6C_05828 [Rhodopirellula europaea 6C]
MTNTDRVASVGWKFIGIERANDAATSCSTDDASNRHPEID